MQHANREKLISSSIARFAAPSVSSALMHLHRALPPAYSCRNAGFLSLFHRCCDAPLDPSNLSASDHLSSQAKMHLESSGFRNHGPFREGKRGKFLHRLEDKIRLPPLFSIPVLKRLIPLSTRAVLLSRKTFNASSSTVVKSMLIGITFGNC
jgi:hypothetical protein